MTLRWLLRWILIGPIYFLPTLTGHCGQQRGEFCTFPCRGRSMVDSVSAIEGMPFSSLPQRSIPPRRPPAGTRAAIRRMDFTPDACKGSGTRRPIAAVSISTARTPLPLPSDLRVSSLPALRGARLTSHTPDHGSWRWLRRDNPPNALVATSDLRITQRRDDGLMGSLCGRNEERRSHRLVLSKPFPANPCRSVMKY